MQGAGRSGLSHNTDNARNPAREESYALFSRLFLEELDAATARELRELPWFEALIPPEAELSAWLDDLAVEYQRLFGMNVYPYEALFVDTELLLNTAATERVVQLFEEAGFVATAARVGAPDHLGLELRLMRDLIAGERRAAARGDNLGMVSARALQRRCVAGHLAVWAPLCCASIVNVAREPLYTLLARLTVDLVLGDLEEFGPSGATLTVPVCQQVAITADAMPAEGETEGDEFDPESPIPLRPYSRSQRGWDDEGEGPGINSVVRRLLTPAEAGLFLARAQLNDIARALDLPAPVGDRFQMLRGLFTAAGQFDQVVPLLGALEERVAAVRELVDDLSDRYPSWAAYASAWVHRLDASAHLIAQLRAQAIDGISADGTPLAR